MSEEISNQELRSMAKLVRPEFRVGFARRRKHYTSAEREPERPVLAPMSVKVVEMPKDELEKLPGLTYYR